MKFKIRIPHPLPKRKHHPLGGVFFLAFGFRGFEPIQMPQGVFCKGRFYPLRKIHMTAAHLW